MQHQMRGSWSLGLTSLSSLSPKTPSRPIQMRSLRRVPSELRKEIVLMRSVTFASVTSRRPWVCLQVQLIFLDEIILKQIHDAAKLEELEDAKKAKQDGEDYKKQVQKELDYQEAAEEDPFEIMEKPFQNPGEGGIAGNADKSPRIKGGAGHKRGESLNSATGANLTQHEFLVDNQTNMAYNSNKSANGLTSSLLNQSQFMTKTGKPIKRLQILPYLGADKPVLNEHQIKKTYCRSQKLPFEIHYAWVTDDQTKWIFMNQTDDQQSYAELDVEPHNVILGGRQVKHERYKNLCYFYFTSNFKYFIQRDNYGFTITEVGSLDNFFKGDLKLYEKQRDSYVAIKDLNSHIENTILSTDDYVFFQVQGYSILIPKMSVKSMHDKINDDGLDEVTIKGGDFFEEITLKPVDDKQYVNKVLIQKGLKFFLIYENNRLCTQIYSVEDRSLYKISYDMNPKDLEEERSSEGGFFGEMVRGYLHLYLQLYENIVLIKYDYDYKNYEYTYCRVSSFKFQEKGTSSDLVLFKKFKNLFYLSYGDTVTIFDQEKNQQICSQNVEGCIGESSGQSSINPFIIAKQKIFNLIQPEPLLTNIKELEYGVSSGCGLGDSEAEAFFKRKLKEDYIYDQEYRRHYFREVIPEYNIAIFSNGRSTNTESNDHEIVVYQFYPHKQDKEKMSVKFQQSQFGDFVAKVITKATYPAENIPQTTSGVDTNVLDRFRQGLLNYFKEELTIHVIVATQDDRHEYEQTYNEVDADGRETQKREKGQIVRIKVITIFPENIQHTKLSVLHRVEGVTGEWQVFYCKERNEILFQAQTKDGKHEYSQIFMIKPEGRNLTIAKSYTGQYIPQVHLFSDRKIYSSDPKSGALEIRSCHLNHKEQSFFSKLEAKYSTLPKVYRAYKLKQAVLLHMNNEEICITDIFGVQIKCIIKNLFTSGQIYQDRSNPNDLYAKDGYAENPYFRLNLFNNSPVSLPYQLLIKANSVSQYDHKTRTITYFESVENRSETSALSYLRVRTQYDSFLDFEHDWEMPEEGEQMDDFDKVSKGNRKFVNSQDDVFQYIKRKEIGDIMSYNILHRTTFLFWAVYYSQTIVINKVIQIIDSLQLKEIPYLFPEVHRKNVSKIAFDMLIEKSSLRQVIQSMLNLMVNCDPQGLLYQEIIERYLDQFIRYKINLQHYFTSSMPLYEHHNFDTYPQYHENDVSLLIPLNLERNAPLVSIKHRYHDLIHKVLNKKHKNKLIRWVQKVFKRLPCVKKWRRAQKTKKVSDDGSTIQQANNQKIIAIKNSQSVGVTGVHKAKKEEVEVNEVFQIEYNVVNMPGLISKNPKRFMQIVQENADKDVTFLEIPVIQMVVDFKWQKYTEEFFMFQFAKTIIFMASFLADIIIMSPEDGIEDPESGHYIASAIISRIVCSIIMIDHLLYEIKQLRSTHEYLEHFTGDFWNIFDTLIFLLYVAYVPMSFTMDREEYAIKSMQCAIMLLYAIKFNFFLRIFDKLGFLVQMIVTVFYDLRYFLLYFLILVSFFAVMISVILRDVQDHDGIGALKYFVMTLRTSMGDNDIDQAYSEFKALFWIIWFAIMMVGNIVLMNFLIAVVSQSYDDCMTRTIAQSYKVKVDMIVEREQTMNEKELKNTKLFPQYILVRTPVDAEVVKVREAAQKAEAVHQEVKRLQQNLREFRAETKQEVIDQVKEDVEKMKEQMAIMFTYINAKVVAKEKLEQEERAKKEQEEKDQKRKIEEENERQVEEEQRKQKEQEAAREGADDQERDNNEASEGDEKPQAAGEEAKVEEEQVVQEEAKTEPSERNAAVSSLENGGTGQPQSQRVAGSMSITTESVGVAPQSITLNTVSQLIVQNNILDQPIQSSIPHSQSTSQLRTTVPDEPYTEADIIQERQL